MRISPSSLTRFRISSSSNPLPRGDITVLVITPFIDLSCVASPGLVSVPVPFRPLERFRYGRCPRPWPWWDRLKLRAVPVPERASRVEFPRSDGWRIRSRSQRGSFENRGRMPMRHAALKYIPHSTAVQEKASVAPVWLRWEVRWEIRLRVG